jgi:hypothetical protein
MCEKIAEFPRKSVYHSIYCVFEQTHDPDLGIFIDESHNKIENIKKKIGDAQLINVLGYGVLGRPMLQHFSIKRVFDSNPSVGAEEFDSTDTTLCITSNPYIPCTGNIFNVWLDQS